MEFLHTFCEVLPPRNKTLLQRVDAKLPEVFYKDESREDEEGDAEMTPAEENPDEKKPKVKKANQIDVFELA